MSVSIDLQPAYLLHSRPFRDTSLILDFLTPDFGRVSAISRGGRGSGSKSKSLLQPFIPVQISLSGKSELKSLRNVEMRQGSISLKGERLFSALYMNEIIVRLFQSHEADPAFFGHYEQALKRLVEDASPEPVLRNFELALLDTLGYGVDFSAEANTHQPISPGHWYYFQEENGFVRVQDSERVAEEPAGSSKLFRGSELLCIHARNFAQEATRRAAKSVLRSILNSHLGSLPLRSRCLFRKA